MRSAASLTWRTFVVVAVNCAQPILVDIARYHGAADPSCCFFVLPIFASMAVVGSLTCGDKRRLGVSHWRRAAFICSVDLAHQILEKAGLVYTGSALYLIVASFSTVWMALLSLVLLGRRMNVIQWVGLGCVTAGFRLRVSQVPKTEGGAELLGIMLVTTAQILHALAFVLNEKYMNDSKAKIEGPQLVFMCGVINTLVLLLWTGLWTVPRWDELVTSRRKLHGGSSVVVMSCFAGLAICSLLRSSVLWVILKHMGAVSTGILKAARMATVTLLSHIFFCQQQPSQCLTPVKALAALVGMLGLVIYSVGSTIAINRKPEQQMATGRMVDDSEAKRLVAHALTQPLASKA